MKKKEKENPKFWGGGQVYILGLVDLNWRGILGLSRANVANVANVVKSLGRGYTVKGK